jgi:hypothetical protein
MKVGDRPDIHADDQHVSRKDAKKAAKTPRKQIKNSHVFFASCVFSFASLRETLNRLA